MRLLRLIWKDLGWLNSRLDPALKIITLIIAVALVVRVWSLGSAWWMTTVNFGHWGARRGTRLEQWLLPPAALLVVYILLIWGRNRKSGEPLAAQLYVRISNARSSFKERILLGFPRVIYLDPIAVWVAKEDLTHSVCSHRANSTLAASEV